MILLLRLFWVFFTTGLFSFGGGYAMIPLVSRTMEAYGWMTAAELADMVAVSEMTPGPFAVNAATFVGMRMSGLPGAAAATLGVTLPSVLLVLLVARFFQNFQNKPGVQGFLRGVRPAVTGLIAASAWGILRGTLLFSGTWGPDMFASAGAFFRRADVAALVLAAAVFAAVRRFKADPILMIGLSAAAGVLIYGALGLGG